MKTPMNICRGPARREFLFTGLCGVAGLTLGDYLKARAEGDRAGKPEPKAKAVIQIYLQGGFAHMDSFDPKPDAPAEYRGELATVETKLPGIRFSEHLAKTAAIADKITVARSITHTEVDHGRGEHSMFTGYKPSPALTYPSMGSVTAMELGPKTELPPYIVVPNVSSQFLTSGYLNSSFGPFALGSDPGRPNFQVRDLNLPKGVDEARFARRRQWKDLVDDHFEAMESAGVLDAMDSFYQRAYAMLSSTKAREAFNLRSEHKKVLEEYGIGGARPTDQTGFARMQSGPRFLLARRLVEAGARFVTLTFGRWDTHAFHYRAIAPQMPAFDHAFAALINDLDQRGMLDSTLVLVTSEFGRTPRINPGAGRDHWPRVFSVVLAGGGIKRGSVYGSSDPLAAEPKDRPLAVEDYAATTYHLLGVNPKRELMAPGNRPIRIAPDGHKVVKELLA